MDNVSLGFGRTLLARYLELFRFKVVLTIVLDALYFKGEGGHLFGYSLYLLSFEPSDPTSSPKGGVHPKFTV